MDLSLILAVTEHAAGAAAEHEEHNEMPFFVAGGVFAVFAVLVSVYGFKNPDFPGTAGAARGVMTAGALLMVTAVSMAVYVAV